MSDARMSYLGDFLEHYPLKLYRKGEIIVFQGEAPRSAYVIKTGVVKAYNLSTSGDEKPIGFLSELSVFPPGWVYGKSPSAMYYFEAFTDTEVYLVPPDEYVAFVKGNKELLFLEFERIFSDDIGITMRLNALQHSRASDKLIYTLHYLAISHGKQIGPHEVEIQLELTHQDFANLTGLTRETTATELNKLKSLGVIDYGKRTLYHIQTDKLNTVLNDEFMAELDIKL